MSQNRQQVYVTNDADQIIKQIQKINLPTEQLLIIIQDLLTKLKLCNQEKSKLVEELNESNSNLKYVKQKQEQLEKQQKLIKQQLLEKFEQEKQQLLAQENKNFHVINLLMDNLREKREEIKNFKNLCEVKEIQKSQFIQKLKQKWVLIQSTHESISLEFENIINQRIEQPLNFQREQQRQDKLYNSLINFQDVYLKIEQYEQLLRKKSIPQDSQQIIQQMLVHIQHNKNIIQNFSSFIKEAVKSNQELIAENRRLLEKNQELGKNTQIVKELFKKQQLQITETKEIIQRIEMGGQVKIGNEISMRLIRLISDLVKLRKDWNEFRENFKFVELLFQFMKRRTK